MPNPDLFDRAGPFTLTELSQLVGGQLRRPGDGDRTIHDVAPLVTATPDTISFVEKPQFLHALTETKAGAVILRENAVAKTPDALPVLIVPHPYKAYALVTQAFYPTAKSTGKRGPGVVIDPSAEVADDVDIGANSVIGAAVKIGAGTRIGRQTVISEKVQIGRDCLISDGVTIQYAIIGDRVTLHPGVRVGQDGFGFAIDTVNGHVKVPQLGRVLIGEDVEVGANSTIDRGTLEDTVIGPGTWLDNLVQIGHNVKTGRGCVIVAQVGLAGGVELGDFVSIGGQAGVAGHVKIGTGAQIAAQSGVMQEVPAGAKVGGMPARPLAQMFREYATLKKISRKS